MSRVIRGNEEVNKKVKRENILKQANEAYAIEKKDSKKWQEVQEELALWDTTLLDGLDDE